MVFMIPSDADLCKAADQQSKAALTFERFNFVKQSFYDSIIDTNIVMILYNKCNTLLGC